MSNSLQNLFGLAARLLFVVLFLPAGLTKLTGFSGTVAYISSVGLPFATLGAAIAVVVEIIGSLALLAGVGTRAAAGVLAFFTLAATFFFHAFWSAPADQVMVQQLMFYKNLAVVGGLLMLVAYGGGGLRLPAPRNGKGVVRPSARA